MESLDENQGFRKITLQSFMGLLGPVQGRRFFHPIRTPIWDPDPGHLSANFVGFGHDLLLVGILR